MKKTLSQLHETNGTFTGNQSLSPSQNTGFVCLSINNISVYCLMMFQKT